MLRESEILITVLEELSRWSIVALPIHGGLMVARSEAGEASATMERVAREMTGLAFPVEEKTTEEPPSALDQETVCGWDLDKVASPT